MERTGLAITQSAGACANQVDTLDTGGSAKTEIFAPLLSDGRADELTAKNRSPSFMPRERSATALMNVILNACNFESYMRLRRASPLFVGLYA